MNAYHLHKPDGSLSGFNVCGVCGQVALDANFHVSEKCCTCYECGEPIPAEERRARNTLYHDACDRARRQRIEAAALEKAELVEDYAGPVYYEGGNGSYGDGYFADVDELAEYLDETIEDEAYRPLFAFCCTETAVRIDAGQILESACEEMDETAPDRLEGEEAFRAAVDAFNKANRGTLSYYEDRKRKVAVPPPVTEPTAAVQPQATAERE